MYSYSVGLNVCLKMDNYTRNLVIITVRVYLHLAWRFNYWELRGVPVRIEIGPRDLKKGEVTLARRDLPGAKSAAPEEQVVELVKELLEKIHKNLYDRYCTTLRNVRVHTQLYEHIWGYC